MVNKLIKKGSTIGVTMALGLGVVGSDLEVFKPIQAQAEEQPSNEEIDVKKPIEFKDNKLETQVRTLVSKPTGDLYQDDLDKVTTLTLSDYVIGNLEDLKYFTNMNKLTITDVKATELDLTDIMPKLATLNLTGSSYLKKVYLGDKAELTSFTINNMSSLEEITAGYLPKLASNTITNLPKVKLMDFKTLGTSTIMSVTNTSVSELHIRENNPKLITLGLENNPNLKIFDVESQENLSTLKILGSGLNKIDLSDKFAKLVSLNLSKMNNLDFELGTKPLLNTLQLDDISLVKPLNLQKNPLKNLTNIALTNLKGVETSENKGKVVEGVEIKPTIDVLLKPYVRQDVNLTNSDIGTLDFGEADSGFVADITKLTLNGTYIKDIVDRNRTDSMFRNAINSTTLTIDNSRINNFDVFTKIKSFKLNTEILNLTNYPYKTLNIPDDGITKLKTISIINAPNLESIEAGKIDSLTTFEVKNTPKIKTLDKLKDSFANLTTVTVNDSQISDVDFLKNKSNLITVNLDSNLLRDIDGLQNLEKLDKVSVNDNMLTTLPTTTKSGKYATKFNLLSEANQLLGIKPQTRAFHSSVSLEKIRYDIPYLIAGNFFDGVFTPIDDKNTFKYKDTIYTFVRSDATNYLSTYSTGEQGGYTNFFSYSSFADTSTTDFPTIPLKTSMNLGHSDIYKLDSGSTMPLVNKINLPNNVIDLKAGNSDKLNERIALKIGLLDNYFVDAKYGKVSNVRFEKGTVMYDYTAPQTKENLTEELVIQLFEGYQYKQTLDIVGSPATSKPNIVYNKDGNLVGNVSPNSDIKLYDSFDKLLKTVKSDNKGSILVDMSEFDIYNKTFSVTATTEGYEESPKVNVLFKDTFPPEISAEVPDVADVENVTIKATATDNVEVKSLDWVYGERTSTTYSDGTAIKNGKFTVSKNGVYTVRATDVNGNTSLKYVNVTGLYEEANQKPSIKINYADKNLSATVSIEDKNTTAETNILKYRINDEGWLTYKGSIKLIQNAKIEAKIIDKKGIETPIATELISEINSGYIEKPIFNQTSPTEYKVNLMPNLEYVVKNKTQDYTIKSGIVSETGIVNFNLNKPIKDGDIIEFVAKDNFGNLDKTELLYEVEKDLEDLTVKEPYRTKVTANNTVIEGYGTPNSTIQLVDDDGKVFKTTKTNDNGLFSIKLAENPMTILYLQSISDSGYKTDKVKLDLSYAITDIEVQTDTTSFKGTGTPNTTITIEDSEGKVLTSKPVVIKADGSYDIDITDDMKDVGDVVIIYTDENGNEQSRQSVYLGETVSKPTLTTDGNILMGSSQKEVYVSVLKDGQIIGSGYTSGGNYNIELLDEISNGDSITYLIKDSSGNIIENSTVKYIDTQPYVTSSPKFNGSGNLIIGKTKPNATYSITNTEGTEVYNGKSNNSGEYSVLLDDVVAENTVLNIKLTDVDGKVLDYVAVKYSINSIDVSDEKSLIYDDKSNTITGVTQPTNSVEITDSKGVVHTVIPDKNGKYSYTFDKELKNGNSYSQKITTKEGSVVSEITREFKDDYTFKEIEETSELDEDIKTVSKYEIKGSNIAKIYYTKGIKSSTYVISSGNIAKNTHVIPFKENGDYTIVVEDTDGNTFNQVVSIKGLVSSELVSNSTTPEDNKPTTDDGKTPVEDNKPTTDDGKTPVEDNKPTTDDGKTPVEDNKPTTDDGKTPVEDNKPTTDDGKTPVEDNKPTTDDGKTPVEDNKPSTTDKDKTPVEDNKPSTTDKDKDVEDNKPTTTDKGKTPVGDNKPTTTDKDKNVEDENPKLTDNVPDNIFDLDENDSDTDNGSNLDGDDSDNTNGSNLDGDDSDNANGSNLDGDNSDNANGSNLDGDDSDNANGSNLDGDDSDNTNGSNLDGDKSAKTLPKTGSESNNTNILYGLGTMLLGGVMLLFRKPKKNVNEIK